MDLLKKALSLNSIPSFNEVQKKAIEKNLLEGNMVVSSPTASGKTLIAEIAALNSIINKKKKVLYSCPLRALASEHFNEFKKKYSAPLSIKPTISTGDFDSSSRYLQNYDIIFSTPEKIDSLLRHKAEWLSGIGLLVVDEIHEIDSDRGPVIEMIVSKLRLMNPSLRVLALSATIPNAKELSSWLKAKLVESDFRPVKLKEGIFFSGLIDFIKEKQTIPVSGEPVKDLVQDTLAKQKQALVFSNTRKNSMGTAKKLASAVGKTLLEKEKKVLLKKSFEALNALESPTEQCRTLSSLIKDGVAFHNAGLVSKQRSLVEELFREGYLKVIAATPTLCLFPDSLVWVGVKNKKVCNLKDSDSVFALDENTLKQTKIREVQPISNPKKLLKISTVLGHSVQLTENHRVLVKRDGKRRLIEAKYCKTKDKIASVRKISLSKTKKSNFNDFVFESPSASNFPLDKEWFYFIGAMLGDGYSGAEKWETKILFKGTPCIVNEDKEIFSRIQSLLKCHDLHFRETKNYYGTPSLFLTKKKSFREFLCNCGIDIGPNKFIQEKLMQSNNECVRALLQGLFDTDGHVQKRSGVGFSNISKQLIEDTQRLLFRFGIVSRVRKKKASKIVLNSKQYPTRPCFELLIEQKQSLIDFHDKIGFTVKRKEQALIDLANKILSNIYFSRCNSCNYTIYYDLFSGRTKEQKEWGKRKKQIIKLIWKKKEITSTELAKYFGFSPTNNELRLNHHYELVNRTKKGSNDWLWELNRVGEFISKNYLGGNKPFADFFKLVTCPICKNNLTLKIKKGWRAQDFEGDIFWDIIKKVEEMPAKGEQMVYDVVLPEKGNNHLLVVNGLLVHNSAGINMPAFRVLIPSLYRFTSFGNERIPVREYKQYAGRAGRPKFDSVGESILIARSEPEVDELKDEYILGEPEDVVSNLGREAVLRVHALALIASDFVFDLDSLEKFFSHTLYFHQFKDKKAFLQKIQSVLTELKEMNFISADEKHFKATVLGKRVSELYLDPLSGFKLIQAIKKKKFNELSFLFLLSSLSELQPLPSISRSREAELWEKLEEMESLLPIDLEKEMFLDPFLLQKFNFSLLLNDWIEEVREEEIAKTFKVQPGILQARLQIIDWLSYSCFELAKLLDEKELLSFFVQMRKRLKQGIKKKLLVLTELKGIGRVRARRLFNSGIKKISELKKTPLNDLSRLLGAGTAVKVKQQLGEKISVKEKKSLVFPEKSGQTDLTGF